MLETFTWYSSFFFLNACDDSPVRQLLCNGYIHTYNRLFKKGHDIMQKNYTPFAA